MKLKLILTALLAVVSSAITVGLATKSFIVIAILAFVFAIIATTYCIFFVEDLLKCLFNYITKKKKMRNKRKEIRLRAVYTYNNEGHTQTFSRIFSGDDLTICIQNAMQFARQNGCEVKSFYQLTTE